MVELLTYQEAKEIYETIQANLDRTDPDITDLYDDMVRMPSDTLTSAPDGAPSPLTRSVTPDDARTKKYDVFIAFVNIVAHTQGTAGAAW